MKLFGFSPKFCAWVFFLVSLFFWGLLAWKIGYAEAVQTVWVPREKIVGAEPYTTIEQINTIRGLLFGVPVFLFGGLISAVLAEFIYAGLSHFRNRAA